ncbi:MAG: hypothetical protein GWP05_04530 [Anaerolineaceae bacterium]|nr:hypothetical protein [Anaerolineaceae bacterium]
MGDLMAALEAGVPASKPTVAAKPVTVARKAKAAKANGTKQTQADDSDDEPAAKKRDLMPIILIGSAGLVLLLTVVGLIVLRGGDSKKPKPETVSPEMVLPEDDGYRGGNDSNGFFPGIPGGRTSKDYEREHGKKALNKR